MATVPFVIARSAACPVVGAGRPAPASSQVSPRSARAPALLARTPPRSRPPLPMPRAHRPLLHLGVPLAAILVVGPTLRAQRLPSAPATPPRVRVVPARPA